ncbi:MAG: protein kinase [Polyangia bacterium]
MQTSCADNRLIAQRFRILGTAGSGGMGTVYRGMDQHTGLAVALKLLRPEAGMPQERHRFLREAQLLSQLRHPHIVSYVAHGYTENGIPYLAMEWLDGEDLETRLRRKGLSAAESLILLRQVAEALAVAHRRGVLHRDLKPSNLFLRGGQIERVTVLDFGIARQTLGSSLGGSTQTGMILGTPQYMAPEQARGQRDLRPSADIFALGCVLFECLTGRPPFSADHMVAVLAKILFEEPPPLRSVRAELPAALEALVSRLLSKDPARRPRDAGELLVMLDGISLHAPLDAPLRAELSASMTLSAAELRVVSIILMSRRQNIEVEDTLAEDLRREQDTLEGLRAALSLYGADAEYLAGDSLVATLIPDERRVATDQAAQAARLALALRERWPGAAVALATGRGVLRERLPIGDVIDRVVRLLPAASAPSGEGHDCVIIDAMTAGLLDGSFELRPLAAGSYALCGERQSIDEVRLLLGRPTPCVGRDQELDMLDRLFADCVEQSVCHAVLITSPPGHGKSRLRLEFMRRLRVRSESIEVLFGRGETLRARSAYGLLRQVLCRLCGITGLQPRAEQQQRLLTRIGRHLARTDAQRIAVLFGELFGQLASELGELPLPDAERPSLQRAPKDPWLLSQQLGQALVDFLRAECAVQPVVLLLEDLHNADPLSIKLLERALRELEEQPFFMVALARPEIKELFPSLWSGRVQEIPLRGLSRKACERLVLEILGRQAPPSVVARIVHQASGNALFLEELIRAQAEGKAGELPETVLAMLQSRIARLGAQLRRVLRAGSVFGETFWRGGVVALLGWEPLRHKDGPDCEDGPDSPDDQDGEDGAGAQGSEDSEDSEINGCLAELVRAEILQPHRDSRYPGEAEYGFCHALMREAAYGLLTDEDKRTGHLHAARYLEEHGEKDPFILAEHRRRGEDPLLALRRA